jgi:hypothetical protein
MTIDDRQAAYDAADAARDAALAAYWTARDAAEAARCREVHPTHERCFHYLGHSGDHFVLAEDQETERRWPQAAARDAAYAAYEAALNDADAYADAYAAYATAARKAARKATKERA